MFFLVSLMKKSKIFPKTDSFQCFYFYVSYAFAFFLLIYLFLFFRPYNSSNELKNPKKALQPLMSLYVDPFQPLQSFSGPECANELFGPRPEPMPTIQRASAQRPMQYIPFNGPNDANRQAVPLMDLCTDPPFTKNFSGLVADEFFGRRLERNRPPEMMGLSSCPNPLQPAQDFSGPVSSNEFFGSRQEPIRPSAVVPSLFSAPISSSEFFGPRPAPISNRPSAQRQNIPFNGPLPPPYNGPLFLSKEKIQQQKFPPENPTAPAAQPMERRARPLLSSDEFGAMPKRNRPSRPLLGENPQCEEIAIGDSAATGANRIRAEFSSDLSQIENSGGSHAFSQPPDIFLQYQALAAETSILSYERFINDYDPKFAWDDFEAPPEGGIVLFQRFIRIFFGLFHFDRADFVPPSLCLAFALSPPPPIVPMQKIE